jgi:P-type Cu+ transporter
MPEVEYPRTIAIDQKAGSQELCYHCGIPCITKRIAIADKYFCCEGCKLVYEILNSNGLCDYYKIQDHPGLAQIRPVSNEKYAYLDNEAIAKTRYSFTDGDHTIVTFYIPGVHCSSCMWQLEHLPRLHEGVMESRLNFTAKEVTIHFYRKKISLRKVVELLATIGYEPYISLEDAGTKRVKQFDKSKLYKLGVAGFCFGNIMMMSFPEYLSATLGIEQQYVHLFRYFNVLLAVPVFFYSASEFFATAWKGLQQKMLNIDAPIALAIIITFGRSLFEIFTDTGAGYLDSMSGIVFFMLVGRVVQERTYRSISFTRDYTAYFPIAVHVVTDSGLESRMLQDLKKGDVIQLHYDEVIPADAMLVSDEALIDYSFVTGESEPVTVRQGETLYAGGKHRGATLTAVLEKPVVGSYLTSLWNDYAFSKDKEAENTRNSAIHVLSKYFTLILLAVASLTAAYWWVHDTSKILPSVTAILIVACPCALLLSVTFTNGNLLRIFSNNGLFLRDASVIEQLSAITHIAFDKTGTLTRKGSGILYAGHQLSDDEKRCLYSAVMPSRHPHSKAILLWLGRLEPVKASYWKEIPGHGIESIIKGRHIRVGSKQFVMSEGQLLHDKGNVFVSIDGNITSFNITPHFRDGVTTIIERLRSRYRMAVLSGDHDRQRMELTELFGSGSELHFEQKPLDKLHYVEQIQKTGGRVLMIGDGLNDAGALQQSNVGITLTDDVNNFTPSCDAILDAQSFSSLPALLRLSRYSKYIIYTSFAVSILYNIAGLYFAVQGRLNPMLAAILMPCSTLCIVLITWGLSTFLAMRFGLKAKDTL